MVPGMQHNLWNSFLFQEWFTLKMVGFYSEELFFGMFYTNSFLSACKKPLKEHHEQ